MLQVNVARLHDDNREALSLAWIAGREGGTTVRREAARAASLIGRGHGVVADDTVEISRIAANTLDGRCPPMLKHFLEVRGLGLLNIRTIFGETAVRPKMKLKLIAHLEKPRPEGRDPGERLPLADLWGDLPGVTLPQVTLPVAA